MAGDTSQSDAIVKSVSEPGGPFSDATAPKPGLLRFIVDHNPFFLLSGLCMLAGCFQINAAVHEDPDRIGVLLGLIGIFNLYELLVIGLGLYLYRTRNLVRDAAYLLVLEVLLLVDVTLLFNTLITADLFIGVLAGLGAGVLALVKIAVIAHFLGLRLHSHAWVLLVLNMMLVFAVPAFVRVLGEAEMLTAWTFTGMWWLAAILLAAHAFPQKWWTGGASHTVVAVGLALAILPILSVIGHIRASHYVYDHAVHWHHYAPIVLAIAFVGLHRLDRIWFSESIKLGVTLAGIVAVLLAMTGPGGSTASFGEAIELWISPLRLTLFAAAGLYGWTWFRLGGWAAMVMTVVCLLMFAAGHTPSAMRLNILWLRDETDRLFRESAPSTPFQWGVVTVVAAFVLLAIGAAVSLRRKPGVVPTEVPGEDPEEEPGGGPAKYPGGTPGVESESRDSVP